MERTSGTAAVVIPARLGARRFPRKVLAHETGKFLVEHVWEAASQSRAVSRVIIATDSEEVASAVRSFGGEFRMTSPDHVSGTDRVAEVAESLDENVVINVQGDEPLISAGDLELLLDLFDERGEMSSPPIGRVDMTTLAVRRTDPGGFRDPNIVKAVIGTGGRALYFSRAPVPYVRVDGAVGPGDPDEWWQHLGIYGYRREFLLRFARLAPTPLEERERLEQLRALEHGHVIRVGEARGRHIGIDTPEEYQSFVEWYREHGVRASPRSGGGV